MLYYCVVSLCVFSLRQTPRYLSRDASLTVELHCNFYSHSTEIEKGRDYSFKDVGKVKSLDVHPVQPWVVTIDHVGVANVAASLSVILLLLLLGRLINNP